MGERQENAKYKTANAKCKIWLSFSRSVTPPFFILYFIFFTFHFPALRGDDRLGDDVAELAAFVESISYLLLWKQIGLDDEAQPGTRFAQFFQADAEFVDKISATLGGAGFFVVRQG